MDMQQKPSVPNKRLSINTRGLVLQAMVAKDALTDETMPVEKMRIFAEKPFREWPKEMQDQLRPFGAEMIE